MWPIAIAGHLKQRLESPALVAARLSVCLARLADLDPLFTGWVRGGMRHRSAVPRVITLPPDEVELRTWIVENAIFESREGRKQHLGYSLNARTSHRNPIRADFWLSWVPSDHWFRSRIGITIFDGQGPSPSSETDTPVKSLKEVLCGALTTLGTAWECESAGVVPGDYGSKEELPLKYESGWMVYLDQSPARHLGDMRDIIAEKLANNALLLTATSDTKFDPHNPVNWAAAVRIQSALAPLNERRKRSTER
jgi:hypothetical protein